MAHVSASGAGAGGSKSNWSGVRCTSGNSKYIGSGVKSMALAPFIVGKAVFMVVLVALVG